METTLKYYRLASGAIESVEITGESGGHVPADGAVEISEAEYDQELAQIRADREAREQQERAEELQRLADDLAALVAAGIPGATARRMLGITPDMELPPPGGGQ